MTNQNQIGDGTLGAQEQTKPEDRGRFTLSILIDLSHPVFANRNKSAADAAQARLQLAEILSELAGAAISGTESALSTDEKGVTIGGLLIQKQYDSAHAMALQAIEVVAFRRDPNVAAQVKTLRERAAAQGAAQPADETADVVAMLRQLGVLR